MENVKVLSNKLIKILDDEESSEKLGQKLRKVVRESLEKRKQEGQEGQEGQNEQKGGALANYPNQLQYRIDDDIVESWDNSYDNQIKTYDDLTNRSQNLQRKILKNVKGIDVPNNLNISEHLKKKQTKQGKFKNNLYTVLMVVGILSFVKNILPDFINRLFLKGFRGIRDYTKIISLFVKENAQKFISFIASYLPKSTYAYLKGTVKSTLSSIPDIIELVVVTLWKFLIVPSFKVILALTQSVQFLFAKLLIPFTQWSITRTFQGTNRLFTEVIKLALSATKGLSSVVLKMVYDTFWTTANDFTIFMNFLTSKDTSI